MRDDALNLENYPVRMERISVKHIPISHICSTDNIKSRELLVNETLSQVCSTDKDKSKGIIVDKIFT